MELGHVWLIANFLDWEKNVKLSKTMARFGKKLTLWHMNHKNIQTWQTLAGNQTGSGSWDRPAICGPLGQNKVLLTVCTAKANGVL
jgi:hypothetical protein